MTVSPLTLPAAVTVRTVEPRAEVAWFAALCSDDYEYLGVPDGALRSNFSHCRSIAMAADRLGYGNILLPSSWQVGQCPSREKGDTSFWRHR